MGLWLLETDTNVVGLILRACTAGSAPQHWYRSLTAIDPWSTSFSLVEVICTLQRRSGASKNAPSSAPRDREHELALQVVCTTPSMICVACMISGSRCMQPCTPGHL